MSGRITPVHHATSRRRKRAQPPVLAGTSSSYKDKDKDFLCLVCLETIDESFMTKCGHSFCYKCIKQCIERDNHCPRCNSRLDSVEQIFPNCMLNELIRKQTEKEDVEKRLRLDHQKSGNNLDTISDMLDTENLDLYSINYMLNSLWQRKQRLEGESQAAQNQILKEFLCKIQEKKQAELNKLTEEMALIKDDLSVVQETMTEHCREVPHLRLSDNDYSSYSCVPHGQSTGEEGFNGSKQSNSQWLQHTVASRRKKVTQHFDDLEHCYFTTRKQALYNTSKAANGDDTATTDTADSDVMAGCSKSQNPGLSEFTESLAKFTKFGSIRTLANLGYASDIYSTSNIVSSIEFDRDSDHFAIAGVTKKIKVFEYGAVIRNAVDIHYPIIEMLCNSKISSVIWNCYHSNLLASSDYEGTITLWDVFTGVKSKIFQEHEKRCWSVDFNKMNPKLLASGSDDSKVKLWCTNMEHSVCSIEAKANVCCVKFNPNSSNHLAFGSADHGVHYYDLRKQNQPLMLFKGHRKAVSYTKFINSEDIVSASTDSQLKLWNINKSQCLRTFRGHVNEKNFVGLATDGDYIACGSENNSLYIYYKGLSKQLITYKFDPPKTVLEKDRREEDVNEFVSAVSWRPRSNVLVAANSQGTIKVLELV